MRRIAYTLHFVGRATPVSTTSTVKTSGSATSCVITTTVSPAGVQADLRGSAGGDLAFFESELRLKGADQFEEEGQITFGDESEHVLEFVTLGVGHIVTGIQPGLMAGSANWRISGGTGQFAGAQGLISSTFTITDSGDRSDLHCALIFVPEE